MLDLKFVCENLDLLRERLPTRGMEVDLAPVRVLEGERRALILEIEELRARRNAVSKEIAAAKKRGEGAAEAVAAMREVGDRIQALEGRTAPAPCWERFAGTCSTTTPGRTSRRSRTTSTRRSASR